MEQSSPVATEISVPRNTKWILLGCIVVLLLVFVGLHVQKYYTTSDSYAIEQQELEYVKGDSLYNQLQPLVITFIEDDTLERNVKEYRLYSSLTFWREYQTLPYVNRTTVYKATSEITLLRSRNPGKTYVVLFHPKYASDFQREDALGLNRYLHAYRPLEASSSPKYIVIVIHEYNILSIPRHWFFQIQNVETPVESAEATETTEGAELTEDPDPETSEEGSTEKPPRVARVTFQTPVQDFEVFLGNGILTRILGAW